MGVEGVRLDVHDDHVEEPEEEVLRQVDVSPTPALLVAERLSHVRGDVVYVLVHLVLLLAGELAIVGIGTVRTGRDVDSVSPRASGARAEIVTLAVVAVIELDRHAGQTERVAVPTKPAYSGFVNTFGSISGLTRVGSPREGGEPLASRLGSKSKNEVGRKGRRGFVRRGDTHMATSPARSLAVKRKPAGFSR